MPINIDEDADRLSKFEKGITNILSRNKNLLFENVLAGINSHFGSAATEHYYNFIVQAWENVTGETNALWASIQETSSSTSLGAAKQKSPLARA